VYFVDDNFIAHRRAVRELLPHLIDWQKRNEYPLALSCEATLNIAKRPEILALMREALFESIFCGIETPDPDSLKAIAKQHNMMVPILEAVRTLNDYGFEVVSGIILGLDGDTAASGRGVLDFIERSNIAMLTINLLQALPRTPLWDRLERDGRLIEDEDRESNVDFLMPYDQVLAMWRDCMATAYRPEAVLARYAYQVREIYSKRIKPRRRRPSWRDVRRGLHMLRRIIWVIGIRGDYRREFWTFAMPLLLRGDVESIIRVGLMAHHLIVFARGASSGRHNASHYSSKVRMHQVAAE
jgi:radical SAM superfamily enzyme YgiQ (UPF0313 family)